MRYAGFSRTRSSASGTSSSRAVASRIVPLRCTVPGAVDVATRQLELERPAQQVGVGRRRIALRAFERAAEAPPHQPPSTVSSSYVIVSFSVSTAVSPAFIDPISSVFGHAFVIV